MKILFRQMRLGTGEAVGADLCHRPALYGFRQGNDWMFSVYPQDAGAVAGRLP